MYHNQVNFSKIREKQCKKLLSQFFLIILLLVLGAWSVPAAHGQVEVEITPPQLEPGMAQIEALVTTEIQSAAAEIADFAESFLTKPSLYRATGDSGAAAAALHPLRTGIGPDDYYIGIGSSAGVATESYDFDKMKRKVENIEETDDFYLGAGVKPLSVHAGIPADFIFPGVTLGFGVVYLETRADEYNINSIGTRLTAGYPLLPVYKLNPCINFSGVRTSLGFSFLKNTISTHIHPGVVSETIDFDPLGEDAPIFTQSVTIEVEPDIAADLSSTVFSLGLEFSTGVELIDSLHLNCGVTGEIVLGTTSVGLESDDEIQIIGYLSELVEEPSRLVISGSTEPVAPSLFQASVFTSFAWQVGTYFFSIPVSWRWNGLQETKGGVGAGIFFGVGL